MGRAEKRRQEREERKYAASAHNLIVKNNELHEYYQKQVNEQIERLNKSYSENKLKMDKEQKEFLAKAEKDRRDAIENDWYWFYCSMALALKKIYHKNNDYIQKFCIKINEEVTSMYKQELTRDEVIALAKKETGVEFETTNNN